MAVSTANDKWLGYGDATLGVCQSFKDASHIYPRFHQFGSAGGTDNTTTSAFQRVDLDIANRATATYQHDWTDASGAESITRSFDDEMTNYANWFAYYRTRITAVKTVTSLTFLGKLGNTFNLDDTFRVGLHTLSNKKAATSGKFDPAAFVDVQDFDATQKAAWYAQLLGDQHPAGPGNADVERDVADRGILLARWKRGIVGRDRSDHPVVSEELAHAVHRRLHQPGLAADVDGRRPGRQGADTGPMGHCRSTADAGNDHRTHAGIGVAASVPRRSERCRGQRRVGLLDELLGHRPASVDADERRHQQQGPGAVAAPELRRDVARHAGHSAVRQPVGRRIAADGRHLAMAEAATDRLQAGRSRASTISGMRR